MKRGVWDFVGDLTDRIGPFRLLLVSIAVLAGIVGCVHWLAKPGSTVNLWVFSYEKPEVGAPWAPDTEPEIEVREAADVPRPSEPDRIDAGATEAAAEPIVEPPQDPAMSLNTRRQLALARREADTGTADPSKEAISGSTPRAGAETQPRQPAVPPPETLALEAPWTSDELVWQRSPHVLIRGRVENARASTTLRAMLDGAETEIGLSDDGAFEHEFRLPAEGEHELWLRAGAAERHLVVHQDTAAPDIRIVSPSEPGACVRSEHLDLQVTAEDAGGVEIYCGDTPLHAIGGGRHAGRIPLPGEGPRTLKVVAEDPAGNRSEASLVVHVDRTAPRLRSNDPPTSQLLRPGTTISVALDFDEPVVECTLAAQALQTTGTSARGTLRLPNQTGVYTPRWTATDACGNEAHGSLHVEFEVPKVNRDEEPNDNRESATVVGPTGTSGSWSVSGRVGVGSDSADWFRFRPEQDGVLRLTLRNTSPGGRSTDGFDLDEIQLWLPGARKYLDSSGTRVEPSKSSSLDPTPLTAGEWVHIRIAPNKPLNAPHYALDAFFE